MRQVRRRAEQAPAHRSRHPARWDEADRTALRLRLRRIADHRGLVGLPSRSDRLGDHARGIFPISERLMKLMTKCATIAAVRCPLTAVAMPNRSPKQPVKIVHARSSLRGGQWQSPNRIVVGIKPSVGWIAPR